MIRFAGYEILGLLSEGVNALVYRVRVDDGTSAVLKVARGDRDRSLAELRHEQELVARLPPEDAVQVLRVVDTEPQAALLREDFGAVSLREHVRGKLSVDAFLPLAIRLADLLVAVHSRGIIHKDINPQNVLIAPETGTIKLTDFSCSALLDREAAALLAPDELVGTLPYMAPEQTGRMPRGIDARADLYSLGVVFYEFLAGVRPFRSSDPLQLIHAHLAQVPPRLDELDPTIPPAVAAIVARLLAKDVEARYQSALGLRSDLDACAAQLRERGAIDDDLVLGLADTSPLFRIPERLYGRDAELARLEEALERSAAGRCELALIAGASGIGKSALVRELQRSIAERRGHFVAGKFDQYNRNVPFSALLRALETMLRHVLRTPAAERGPWRARLEEAIGGGLPALVETVPAAATLFGPQPPPAPLAADESQRRLERALLAFFAAFASAAKPLIVFIDDLQWSDAAALRLLRALLTGGTPHLLVIGAYREHEVDGGHPLADMLARVRDHGMAPAEIHLAALPEAEVRAMVADTLMAAPLEVDELAREVYARTQGNPLFVREFLRLLHREGLLRYDPASARWRWSLARIAAAQLPDDVVSLVVAELQAMRPEVLQTLEVAACVGADFDARTIAVCAPELPVKDALWELLSRGLLLPTDADYRLLRQPPPPGEPIRDAGLRFLHDRVQQAVASQIPADRRPALHLAIGRRTLADADARGDLHERLFAIVDHLNIGAAALELDERWRLARLDLEAGRRAKSATAYETAVTYLSAGAELLPDGAFDSDHALAFALAIERCECLSLAGRNDAALACLARLDGRPRGAVERARLCNLEVAIRVAQGDAAEAITVGRRGLADLGLELPEGEEALERAAARGRARSHELLGARSLADLARAPAMSDPEKAALLGLLTNLLAPANLNYPGLFTFLSVTQVNLTLAYGASPESVYGCVVHGFHLASTLGEYSEGYAFGRLGLALHERFGNREVACRCHFVFGSYLHLFRPLREVLEHMERAYEAGTELGDYIYLSYACSHILIDRLLVGSPLASVDAAAGRYLELMKRTKVASSVAVQTVSRQVARALAGDTRGLTSLTDDAVDEADFLASLEASGFRFALHWYRAARTWLLLLAGDPAGAVAEAARHREGGGLATEFLFNTYVPLYEGLAAADLLRRDPDDADAAAMLERVDRCAAYLEERAERSPTNYRHTALLLAAERAELRGEDGVFDRFDAAIAAAEEAELLPHEALALERAAAHHLRRRRQRVAAAYLRDARDAYATWGARAKVAALERAHPALLADRTRSSQGRKPAPPLTDVAAVSLTPAQLPLARIDLMSAIRASQAFTAELELGRMLDRFLHIVLENAGAERAAFVLDISGRHVVAGSLRASADAAADLDRHPLADDPSLPRALIEASFAADEPLVFSDARREESPLVSAAYRRRWRPRALLAAPVRHQGRCLAVLFLENSLSAGVFTRDRLELLGLLAAQMAISMKHALVYEEIDAARQAAESANTAKSSFLANMSHELRTPLNAILGFGELLLESAEADGREQDADDLRKVLRAGRHLLEIISSILDISKIEADRLVVRAATFAVEPVLDEVRDTLTPLAARQKNTLLVRADGDLGEIASDPTRLRQILLNVVGNALKFTHAGLVELVAAREGDVLTFVVHDTGIGMDAADLALIFEAFHQADLSSTRSYEGSGLGLTITRHLCRLLGGQIAVSSELGVGTTFTITLPATLPPAQERPD